MIGSAARTVLAAGLALCGIARAQPPGTQGPSAAASPSVPRNEDAADPGTAAARLHAALAPYRAGDDLRTHLFFRYADAPYTRATIACLIAAERAMTDAPEASALIRWSQAALARVRSGLPLDRAAIAAAPASATPPDEAGMAWLVSAPAPAERGIAAGAVDLVACLGAKRFVDARPGITADIAAILSDRAAFLGMTYRRIDPATASPGLPGTAGEAPLSVPDDADSPEAAAAWRATLWQRVLSGRRQMLFPIDRAWAQPWLIEAAAHCNLDFLRLRREIRCFPAPTDVAVVAPSGTAGRWTDGLDLPKTAPPAGDPLIRETCEALANAQVPVDILAPDALGNSDNEGRYRVLILVGLDPVGAKTREGIRRYRDAGGVLLAVGRCLSEVPRSGPGAIRFDMEVGEDSLGRVTDYVLGLRDRGTILAGQAVPVSPGGGPIRGLRSETAWTGPRECLVYLANRTQTPLSLSLRCHGATLTGQARELIADQPIELTASPFALPAYAVWILRAPASRR